MINTDILVKRYNPAITTESNMTALVAGMVVEPTGEYVKTEEYLKLQSDWLYARQVADGYFNNLCSLNMKIERYEAQLKDRTDKELLFDRIAKQVLPGVQDSSETLVSIIKSQDKTIQSLIDQVTILTGAVIREKTSTQIVGCVKTATELGPDPLHGWVVR